jgi:dihydropteroate synthase
MGILNLTPDSFYDGARELHRSVPLALAHARQLVTEGAALLDLGGQSTRPGYAEISASEEIDRVVPVLCALREEYPQMPLSIDTYKPAVAKAALQAGAHIINDIHGLQGVDGPALLRLALDHDATVIAMHNDPALREADSAADPLPSVLTWLVRTIGCARAAGLPLARLVLDPGIGFGKTSAQNVALLSRLDALHALGQPLLLGVSRKSVISHLLPELKSPAERLEATLVLTALAVRQGIQLHRVHDVRLNAQAARLAAALR